MAAADPVETVSTRSRILDACLRLFNASGPVVVTTAEIARAVGINEGNLYYYFKKKEDIVTALFDQFEDALERVANIHPEPEDEQGEEFGIAYLRRWFGLMWEWRFLYRDSAILRRMAPKLRIKTMALSDRGQADIRRVLGEMADQGLLRAAPEELDRLMINAWIISSYWLDYLHARHNIDNVTREHLDWGFAQVKSLFEPYVDAPAAKPAAKRAAGSAAKPAAGSTNKAANKAVAKSPARRRAGSKSA